MVYWLVPERSFFSIDSEWLVLRLDDGLPRGGASDPPGLEVESPLQRAEWLTRTRAAL